MSLNVIKTSRPSKIEQQAIKQPTTTWKAQQRYRKKLTTNIDLINNWTMTPTATICIFFKAF